MNTSEKTIILLEKVSEEYNLGNIAKLIHDKNTCIREKDIYICLKEIVCAVESEENQLDLLYKVKNLYGSLIFAVNSDLDKFLIKNKPDFPQAIQKLKDFSFCFKLSPYHVINTFLAILVAQVTGFDLNELCKKGRMHIEDSISYSLKNNPNWCKDTLIVEKPALIVPVGAAGCGKSTFYRELSNVVNISCDNIRYLLFKEYGPCFSSWESCLSWWIVGYLTDNYLSKGYNVFYNGVNTDKEYRSPVTMEDSDLLYSNMPYDIKIVYFEPSVKLSPDELKELKSINLWSVQIDELDISALSLNVAQIIKMINDNFRRTQLRTSEIIQGKKEQDPYDVLYAVPAPVVKLFVEQSFDVPGGSNVTYVERKELSNADERSEFYRKYAQKVLQ